MGKKKKRHFLFLVVENYYKQYFMEPFYNTKSILVSLPVGVGSSFMENDKALDIFI